MATSNKHLRPKLPQKDEIIEEEIGQKVIAQFVSDTGEILGPELDIPLNITHTQLETLVNHLQNNADEKNPYSFFLKESEIIGDLKTTFEEKNCNTEEVLQIVYQPQAVFRVKAITRNTGSLAGHSEAVLCVAFSPDGTKLASGSGDTTVRFWDVDTKLPLHECRGHTNWVLSVAWSPDGRKMASGGNDNAVRVWDPATGKQIGSALQGHKGYITAVCWEPFHKDPDCIRLATASKDASVKIWDTRQSRCLMSLTSHTMSITCLKWGGEDIIYSGSQDRTIKCWDAKDGKLHRSLVGHAHWVNTLALNTDYVLRTGPYDHHGQKPSDKNEAKDTALKRWQDVVNITGGTERLISGSDDFTMFMWEPSKGKKSTARLTGHQQLINVVNFSPDGRLIASASFDKSIKIWNGITGKFIGSLRGHVEAVYQVCWSPDSRFIVSGSRDSTLKVWDPRTQKLKFDLPGHADAVYTVDWNGDKVCSGSKDRLLKIWQN